MLAASDGNEDVLPAVVEQELWSASLAAFDSGDYESAAIMGRKIGNKARAIYNVGICYLLLGDEDSARITFERAIKADPFFCIAYFQAAIIYHRVEDFTRASFHYQEAIKSLRDNSSIDYSQLGLEVTAYACEIEYNLAAVRASCLDRGAALRSLVNAHQMKMLPRHEIIDQTMSSNMEATWSLFVPPRDLIFRPKSRQRSLSVGSLRVSEGGGLERELLGLAPGEVDDNTRFMAPIHLNAMEEELEKMQRLNHCRKHSRSSSVVTASARSLCSEYHSLAKLRLMSATGEEVLQSRMISLDDIASFDDLHRRVRDKLALERVQLKFKDDEGDLITLCDDADLAAALSSALGHATHIKVTLWCYPY